MSRNDSVAHDPSVGDYADTSPIQMYVCPGKMARYVS